MRSSQRVLSARQRRVSHASKLNALDAAASVVAQTLTRLGSALTRVPAYLAALTLVAASASCNALFGASLGTGRAEVAVLVAASIASDVLKAASPIALRSAIRDRDLIGGLAAVVILTITATYSGLAAVGFAASQRDATASERQAAADTHERLTTAFKQAEAELAKLPIARPAGEIKAEIAGIEALPGIMVGGVPCGGTHDGPVTKANCPRHAGLKAELAKADARAQLVKRMEDARAALDKLPEAPRSADPQGDAIAAYLSIVGISVTAADLRPWLVAMVALLVEVGSVFGFMTASGSGSWQRAIEIERAEQGGAVDSEPASNVDSGAAVSADARAPATTQVSASKANPARTPADTPLRTAPRPRRGRRLGQSSGPSKEAAGRQIVDTLQAQGGRIEGGSVRGIAALIGGKRSTVHAALAGLIGSGVVVKAAGGALVLAAG